MDNQSTGKSHKALIITIATATLLLAGAGTACYLQYQHIKQQERNYTHQMSNMQTEVKQLSKEINRLQQLSEVGKKVQDNHKLRSRSALWVSRF